MCVSCTIAETIPQTFTVFNVVLKSRYGTKVYARPASFTNMDAAKVFKSKMEEQIHEKTIEVAIQTQTVYTSSDLLSSELFDNISEGS